jgi:hypothetical protein
MMGSDLANPFWEGNVPRQGKNQKATNAVFPIAKGCAT